MNKPETRFWFIPAEISKRENRTRNDRLKKRRKKEKGQEGQQCAGAASYKLWRTFLSLVFQSYEHPSFLTLSRVFVVFAIAVTGDGNGGERDVFLEHSILQHPPKPTTPGLKPCNLGLHLCLRSAARS